ncbi:MAG: hypothetical protein ACKVS9_02460 [Phycisphaerae bacterium]
MTQGLNEKRPRVACSRDTPREHVLVGCHADIVEQPPSAASFVGCHADGGTPQSACPCAPGMKLWAMPTLPASAFFILHSAFSPGCHADGRSRWHAVRRTAKWWATPTLRLLAILGLFSLSTGCAPGIEWRDFKYEPVREVAQRDQRLMLVYFRHWAAVACTKFEDEILKDPAVLTESRNFYCVPLAFDWDRELAEKFGVREIPGVAIVDPTGRVITRLQGTILRDDLLKEMRRARAEFSTHAASSATLPK